LKNAFEIRGHPRRGEVTEESDRSGERMSLASRELSIRGLELALCRETRRALERGDACGRGRAVFLPDRPELRLLTCGSLAGMSRTRASRYDVAPRQEDA
jgi:hypothetical protein